MPLDPKQILLGKIEGIKISNEAFSSASFFNSFPSLGTANSLNFLTDFSKLLFGSSRLKQDFIRFLTTELKSLAEELMKYYKKKIIEYYYCNVDTEIPAYFFEEFSFTVKELDFFGVLKINPTSELGKHYYPVYDTNLDAVLYNALNSPNTVFQWENILTIRYLNGNFYFKLDQSLQGKTIYDFVILYLNNIQLYDNVTIVSDFVDGVFGTLSRLSPISKRNIENKIKLEIILNQMLENFDINDSYFEFDTEDISNQAEKRKSGYYEYSDCELSFVEYDYDLFSNFVDDLLNTSQYNEETYNVNFDYMINQTSQSVAPSDQNTYNGNIFLNFFRYIIKSILSMFFLPKKILFMRIFAKMANKADLSVSFEGFFNEHRNFFSDIIRQQILNAVLKYLMAIVIQELSQILAQSNIKKRQEQLKNYRLAILSLIGV